MPIRDENGFPEKTAMYFLLPLVYIPLIFFYAYLDDRCASKKSEIKLSEYFLSCQWFYFGYLGSIHYSNDRAVALVSGLHLWH